MTKTHIEEALELHDRGHTFYAIAYTLKQWYGVSYTEAALEKHMKCDNNPTGHPKFKGAGHK